MTRVLKFEIEIDTAIPAEATIKNAKEKRERLRTTNPNDDYISLSVTRRAEDQGPHPESRLVREEDELGEGDDGTHSCFSISKTLLTLSLIQSLPSTRVPKSELLWARSPARPRPTNEGMPCKR